MVDLKDSIAETRGWFIALGIALTVLGLISIAFPLFMTITAKIFLGWLFLLGGIAQVVHSFSTRTWGGFFWNLLIGLLYVFVGGWLAFFPLTGLIGLTAFLALMFMAEGVMKAILGFGLSEGKFWVIISGAVSIVVGLLLFVGLPGSALWAIGLLVGINFLFSGIAFTTIGFAIKKQETAAT